MLAGVLVAGHYSVQRKGYSAAEAAAAGFVVELLDRTATTQRTVVDFVDVAVELAAGGFDQIEMK